MVVEDTADSGVNIVGNSVQADTVVELPANDDECGPSCIPGSVHVFSA